jgi:hypothetical protein
MRDRELLGAVARGLRSLGVPDPGRCALLSRWAGLDLVARVSWPDFAIPTKTGPARVPYTDHVLGAAALMAGPEVLRWAAETVPLDALSLLWAELRRVAARYGHHASRARWPDGWPVPAVESLTYAGSGLPYDAHLNT